MATVLPIDWTVVVQGGGGTTAKLPIYDNPDWIKGFDLVSTTSAALMWPTMRS